MSENEKPKSTRELAEHVQDEFKHPRSKLRAGMEHWGDDTPQAMTRLCRSFPTLRGVPGTEPDWQAVARAALDEGGLGLADVGLEPFNVVAARARWDDEHAAAFASWIAIPFWP